ncbi:MAG: thioesterase [Bacteroides sp.]|nr:thioesterase [Ruminococcus flavefaciens]MCM1555019.1 thioesterase [Bacteroides sp.]
MDAHIMTATENIAEFSHSFHIYNHCTDKSGFLRVKTLCDLLNDVAEMHTVYQNADVATLNLSGCTWMLRRIHLVMPDLPAQEADVTVKTWNPELCGLLVPRLYKVSDAENGSLRAFAHTEWLMVNLHAMRPERPTEQMKSIAGLCSEQLPEVSPLLSRAEQKTGFRPDESWTEACRFKAGYADIDFNGHLTQSSYIQRMIDAHGFAFLEQYRMREIEVVYAHEIKPEAAFCVRYKCEGGLISYAVLNEDQSLLHAWARARWE